MKCTTERGRTKDSESGGSSRREMMSSSTKSSNNCTVDTNSKTLEKGTTGVFGAPPKRIKFLDSDC
jgi:hypothetical protein